MRTPLNFAEGRSTDAKRFSPARLRVLHHFVGGFHNIHPKHGMWILGETIEQHLCDPRLLEENAFVTPAEHMDLLDFMCSPE
jgi:hypothetical protein